MIAALQSPNHHDCGVPHSSRRHAMSGIFARRREPFSLLHTTTTSSFRPKRSEVEKPAVEYESYRYIYRWPSSGTVRNKQQQAPVYFNTPYIGIYRGELPSSRSSLLHPAGAFTGLHRPATPPDNFTTYEVHCDGS